MNSEDFQGLRDLRAARQELRKLHAVPCPRCVELLPKAYPKMLLPEERCKMHGYRDPRPRIEQSEVDRVFSSHGLVRRWYEA